MTLVMQLVQLFRKLPPSAYVIAVLVLGLMGACWERDAAVDRAYARGKADAEKGAAFDSTLRSVVAQQHTASVAHTDTVVRRVTVTRLRVDTLVQRIPDSVRVRFPVVDSLVRVAVKLTAQVDTLTRAIDTERAAARLRVAVDSATIVAQRITINAQADRLVDLQKRPGWGKVAGGVLVGALLGVARGVWR